MRGPGHAGGSGSREPRLRFGTFEVDFRAGELRKDGRRIRLQEQPFQILRMLLESPGEVVLREEIRSRLWPTDTVVEFDHSINAAVRRLRDALRDSADAPRYIETVTRRGYRFIGQVERAAANGPLVAAISESGSSNREQPSGDATSLPVPPAVRQRFGFHRSWLFLAALLLLSALGGWYWRAAHALTRPVQPSLQPLVRLDVDLGHEVSLGASPDSGARVGGAGADAILSPDGARLVYVSRSRLFTRSLDREEAIQLADNGRGPFFSPDGKWVGFFSGEKLKKVSINGGLSISLCDAPLGKGASWGEDGNIIAALDVHGLSRVSSNGGAPSRVTEIAPGEIDHRWPQVLAGGRAVLFTAFSSMTGLDGANIEVISLADRKQKTLVRGGTWGRYLPSGHLVYVSNGTLFAVTFNLDRLEVRGTPTPVLEGVAYSSAFGSAQVDFTQNGMLLYQSGGEEGGHVVLRSVDRSGNVQPLLATPGSYLSPAVSPDGDRLALTTAGDIWVYQPRRDRMMRITSGGGHGNPVWSADGRYIAFRAAGGMFWTRPDGTGKLEPLTESNHLQVPVSFTADGKRLAFVETNPSTSADIWTVPVESDGAGLHAGKPEVFINTSFEERTPAFSPDGKWMAYASNESGRYEVYVRSFPDGKAQRQISISGGIHPVWSPRTGELFFRNMDDKVMFAAYAVNGDSFFADTPRLWTEKAFARVNTTRNYDVAPDGSRIVALMPAEPEGAQKQRDQVVFLLNFFDEVRRRMSSVK